MSHSELIAVWFSCGAASAIAARETMRRYGNSHRIRVVNNPVREEDEDNRRFLREVGEWLQVEIEDARNPKWPNASARDVWAKKRFMSGPKGAPCTAELKKRSRQIWEETFSPDWHVFGFTKDEEKRHKNFVMTERDNVLPVLIEAGITKQMCFDELAAVGIELPRIYRLGYPNANCVGCVKATSPKYWNLVRRTHPEVFADRVAQSRDIGVRLVEVGKERIFLDELNPHERRGRPLKSFNLDCGLFCEERLVAA